MQTLTDTAIKKADITYCESMVEAVIPTANKTQKAETTLTLFHFIGLMDVSPKLDYIATKFINSLFPAMEPTQLKE